MRIYKKLSRICECKKNESLKNYCSIKIGGQAKYVCFPKTIRQLKKIIFFVNKLHIKYYVLGNGTNIVFEDNGFNGVIICLKKLNRINISQNYISCYAGANLFYVNQVCAKCGLSGLEFSYGIPGTIGGAVAMNAGAFGGEMKDIVKYVWVLKNNRVKKLKASALEFNYRHSNILNSNQIILKVSFKLQKNDVIKIQELQKNNLQKRLNTQPYGTLNSGSVFKKIENESAGKYIDKLGLKGVKIGDIQISTKHANFFINVGNATSDDLHKAINYASEKVKKEFGLCLQQEIIFVGE